MDDFVKSIPVLVVDDDATQRTILGQILRRIGFEMVDEAADGAEALIKVQAMRPGFVVCDLHMKPMDGLTFVTNLRFSEERLLRNLPVIMVTSDKRDAAIDMAKKLKVEAYIVKPTSTVELKAAAEAALGFELP